MENENNVDLVAGPGAAEESGEGPKPLLEGASEYEYIELLNPLSVDFIAQVGVTRPTHSSVTIGEQAPGERKTEAEVKQEYGLNLRNPDHTARANIVNRVRIKAGQTVKLLGNEAQVVIRQLTNEILQREGKRLMLADPFQRNLVERRIIRSRGNVDEILGRRPQTVREQLQEAIKEPEHEEFPTISRDQTEDPGSERAFEQPTDRNPGSTEGSEQATG